MKKIIIALAAVIAVCAALCACSGLESSSSGGKSGKALSEIWSDIKDEVEFKDFSEFQDIKRLNRSYGITEDVAEEFAGGVNSTGVNQEEVVLVKAKDEDSAKEIEEKLNAKLESKLNQNKNYNPEQAKMMDGCKVEKDGLYVSLIVSENREKITEIYKNGIK